MSSSANNHNSKAFIPLNIAVLTVSDTRDESNDTSGQLLAERVTSSGHKLAAKTIVKDDVYQLRATVSQWIADENIHAVISTGGTGFTLRDNTPEALLPLFDKNVEGFGEIFRAISLDEIGTSTIQSRAFGGIANQTVILCVPGSTNACRTAWDKLIKEQLDASHRPCNFVPHLNINTEQCETRS
ncbi:MULTISPECIES: molybdenum cofactor biosynthesis protein B [Thalassotalea]|uniref:Molybdenum cofactor biosynthesis protein B n=1 Tax=Thalassotalea castellviae TaxID=3075612 RepID=A0ABU2ZZX3_9GAMM|nr:molybdenum cofactor biosynthesis protein B [Thalassotalea sp. W431]MDT0603454.1 molybdenum cofactor biosynthesis protein B [Thalassotalea sp. W431]